ncbi:response regulator [Candidatus Kaiserbacteria bacterium]|nr:response regulator [Candidatus Kaiserbacteria bacterium]
MSDTSQPSVLVLDDDNFLLQMYGMKFSKEGFIVQTYLSVREALEALRKGYKPDAIVFDIVMPESDGFTFLESLRSEHLGEGSCKIALTNQNTDAERNRAHELGADEFLLKATMIPSEVVNTVRTVIEKRKKQ